MLISTIIVALNGWMLKKKGKMKNGMDTTAKQSKEKQKEKKNRNTKLE